MSNLEAREILHHLNSLGYRNLSAEQLKEFMRDLKKLIKYDNRPLQDIIENREIHTETSKLSRSPDDISHHRFFAPTISSTAKLNEKTKKSTENLQILPRQCSLHKNILCPHNTISNANKENKKPVPLSKGEKKTNKMWIRPRSSTPSFPKHDPVALYHAYQKEWSKFKDQLPGENSHADLRWKIREKMLG